VLGALVLVGCTPAPVETEAVRWPVRQEIPLDPGERATLHFRACAESIRVSRLDEGGGALRVERWMQGDPGPLPDFMIYRTHAWTTQSLDRVDRWIVENQGDDPAMLLLECSATGLLREMAREGGHRPGT
jgi:hypothetical protein